MSAATIAQALDDALEGRRLLTHPFYRQWEAGTLEPAALRAYAEQYRHIEAALPGTLARIADAIEPGPAASLVRATLADEEGHGALFETFADAVEAQPAGTAPAAPATAALIALTSGGADPEASLSMVAAYEAQAAEIARTKAAGLRSHYDVDDVGASFWDVHAALEDDHANWSQEALAALGATPDSVETAARQAAEAWWAFLDERAA